MLLTLAERRPETPTSESFRFRPEQPIEYRPGQLMKWILKHEDADERGTERWFTISSSPTEKFIQLTTRFAEDGGSSFKRALRSLQPGDTIQTEELGGSFTLPDDTMLPLVFVAGGIGVTPYRSMLKYLADKGETRDIHLIYANRTKDDIAFKSLLDDLSDAIDGARTTYVNEDSDGRLTPERLFDIDENLQDKLVYLSGPKPMVESYLEELQRLGLPKDRLKTDYFPGYTTI